jgi:hypothetical protein
MTLSIFQTNYYAEAFKIIGGDTYKIRFLNNADNTTQKFLIQTYHQSTNEIQVYCFLCNDTDDWLDTIYKVDLPSKSISTQYSRLKLVFGNTFLKNYVTIINHDNDLTIIDYEKNIVLLRKQLEKLNNFQEETLVELTEIDYNDDFFITYKRRCLTRLNHGMLSAFKTVGSALYVEVLTAKDGTVKVNTWSIEGDSYSVKNNIFCLQFNQNQCFKFYDLNACKEKKAFDDYFITIGFQDRSLLYGFSPDCKFFYTFEYENEFNFYDLKSSVRIACVPVHHPVYSINVTNEFVTMMLDNGVLFSFYIMENYDRRHSNNVIDKK